MFFALVRPQEVLEDLYVLLQGAVSMEVLATSCCLNHKCYKLDSVNLTESRLLNMPGCQK
jgi:hypothetical protein